MALTNNLKQQVDLPVWEWCRFTYTPTTALSAMTASNAGLAGARYLYYQVSGPLIRYDTITDSWHQLATCPAVPTIMCNNIYSSCVGHYGRAISSGGGNNTIEMAGLSGNILVGYKIRIIGGTGAGQERTISAVSAPIIADRGSITTAGTSYIVDANTGIGLKQWKINQWRDYQFRCDFGGGRMYMRPILYNSANTVYWADTAHMGINNWAQSPTYASIAAYSQYVIESHIVTVSVNWTTNPDNTSKFVILSGGIFMVSQITTSAPFFQFQYYNVLNDAWYYKSSQAGLKSAVFLAASDLSMERMAEVGGVIFTETASAGGTRSITSTAALTAMKYANFQIRIVGGTGIGQIRTILSNTTSIINVTRDWDTAPDGTSVYEIWKDTDKIFMIGGGDAAMFQYSINSDQWTTGKQLDYGICNSMAANVSGQEPISITSITRTATGMVGTGTVTTAGTGYNVGDILTVDAKGGTLRVLTITPTTGAVLTVSLETCGTGYTTGAKATTVSPAGGVNCQITLAGGDIDFTELAVTAINHTYKLGDVVTITGATGLGAGNFNGARTIIGTPGITQFSYCCVGDPGAATASFTAVSTTVLVDCTKNWTIDEHKGKIIQISNNAYLATTAQARRIVSNTATTITWTLATTAATPANGTYRYVIEDIKPFGTEVSIGGRKGLGTEGFATGGSTTTLIDSTKNWETNYWSRTTGRKVRIVEGTGVGNEITITSNTATTLTYALQTFTPDATTRYVIMDAFGTATAGAVTTCTDSSQNWETNYWYGKRVKFLCGTNAGSEYTITANTATVLTFASAVAPDTSTAYAILESNVRSYGVHLDVITGSTDTTLNHKYMYAFNGTGTAEMNRYNINTEHWDLMTLFPFFETLTTGAMYCYDGADRIYINLSTTIGLSGRLVYYDLTDNILVPASTIPYGHSTLVSGNRMEIIQTADGLKYLYMMRHSGTEMWRLLLFF
jgi:hypothetical protein